MNAALSSRRAVLERKSEGANGSYSLPTLALIASALVFVVGIQLAMPIIVALGVAGVLGSIIYMNTLFWEHIAEVRKIREQRRNDLSTRL